MRYTLIEQNTGETIMADYDKAAIKKILIERDDLEPEEAQDMIDACQEDVDAILDGDGDLMGLQDCIEDHFGLEPDYVDCFLGDLS